MALSDFGGPLFGVQSQNVHPQHPLAVFKESSAADGQQGWGWLGSEGLLWVLKGGTARLGTPVPPMSQLCLCPDPGSSHRVTRTRSC